MDSAHIKMLRVMDEVHNIVSGHEDIEPMLEALLQYILTILGCDRSWLLYPCDPETPTWGVPMECAVPEWPGAYARNLQVPMDPGVRYVFEAVLGDKDPVTFDPASALQVPPEVTEQFGVQSQMILAVYPKTDRPWMLGVHHCARAHEFTQEDRTLFAGIGRRLGDSLSTLIALRDLRASEANLERKVRERTAELERTNEELKAFSYSVSHDLRAPIRAIRGFADLLVDTYADKLDDRGREWLGYMTDGAGRMDDIVRSLLRLSRATRSELEFETVDVNATAQSIATDLAHGTPSRQVDFSIEPGLQAWADAALLRIAFENLLENAWKYSSLRPDTVIEVGRIADAQELTLFVRDNGVGFDMDQSHKLFQSFKRLHSEREFTGTGIGLATVRRIISRHGGRVWAEGRPGDGATFYVALPAEAPVPTP